MPAYYDEEKKSWYCAFKYRDWRGERKQKKKRGFKLKRDAEKWEREFFSKDSNSPEMTFASLCELYEEDAKVNLREDTYTNRHATIHNKLVPYFGKRITSEITAGDIRKWQNEMKKYRSEKGEPYKETYLRSLNAQLSTIFNWGIQFSSLKSNPCKETKQMGKKQADKMQILTIDQFNKTMEQVDARAKKLAFEVMFWSGLRIGECLALTPGDILDSKELSVSKTYHRRNGEDQFGPTKNGKSRVGPIPNFLYDDIKSYIGALYAIEPTDRIFYFTKSTLNRELSAAEKKAGVPEVRVHDLRHSHAALLVEMGCSIVLVAERLGDTVKVASDTYSHLYPNKQAEVVEQMNNLRGGFAKEEPPKIDI